MLQFTITIHLFLASVTLVNFHLSPTWAAGLAIPVEHFKNTFGLLTVEITTGPQETTTPVAGSRAVTLVDVPNAHLTANTVTPASEEPSVD